MRDDYAYSNSSATAGLYIAHGASSWTALSDERLPYKKAARELSVLDKLDRQILFTGKVGEGDEAHDEVFVKAQSFARAFPQVVQHGNDDPDFVPVMGDPRTWAVSYDRIGPIALQGVYELLERLSSQAAMIEALTKRVAVLEK